MIIFLALIFIFLGGVINGSFALPTKKIQGWNFENIWMNYTIWAFLILPWISIFALAPNVWIVYQLIPSNLLWILIIGGFLFGIGQMCFAKSIKMIGMGLAFVIVIGLATGFGFLLPLFLMHPEKIFTPFGYTTLAGIGLIFAGILLSFYAGRKRDQHKRQIQSNIPAGEYTIGVIMSVVAGVCSAVQNFAFAVTKQLQEIALHQGLNQLSSAMIIWPIFLSFAFIPYIVFMLYLHRKNKSFSHYKEGPKILNGFLTFVMGICWWCSLVLYSQATLWIGSLGPIVGWPLFMVLIILVSNFWGWRHHEWAHVTTNIARQALLAIILLILAVVVLAYSATLS